MNPPKIVQASVDYFRHRDGKKCFSAGKKYEVERIWNDRYDDASGYGFTLINDKGTISDCLEKGCAWQAMGNWIIVEREAEPTAEPTKIANDSTEEEAGRKWYSKPSAGRHQQLIVDESTGENIAVVYNDNEKDGALIAAAPELLEALQKLIEGIEISAEGLSASIRKDTYKSIINSPTFENAKAAIQKATNP